jgi:DNA mismatch repair ATPase MutS
MDSKKIDNKISYLYLLKPGISSVKGGINVLTEMNYPKEIIENTINNYNK